MIHIYRPNRAIKGFAASFWYSPSEDSIFATLIKQDGWDAENQNGTFKNSLNDPNKRVHIKLNFIEAGGILDCIERNRSFSTFHDNEEKPKTINFQPWMHGEPSLQKGFSFSVTVKDKQDTKSNNPFYIGLTFAEAREIREFLIFAMHEHFNVQLQKVKSFPSKKRLVNPNETIKNEIKPDAQITKDPFDI